MNRLKVLTGVPMILLGGIGAAAAFSILAKYKYDHMLVGGIYEEVR